MAMAQESASQSRITGPINENQLFTIKNTVSPLANAQNDRGAVADDMQIGRVHLLLKRSDAQESALRQLIQEMNTPKSANYHKWLTPDQFGQQFGPSDQDVATITSWLAGHGLTVTKVEPGKQTIEFTGNAGQFRSAFHTSIHQYVVNGEKRFANAGNPQIPAALSGVVGGFISLNNFRMTPTGHYLGKAEYNPQNGQATPGPDWTIGNSKTGYYFPLAPADLAVQYDLNPLYKAGVNGNQQSIAIINESNINVAQVNLFRSMFGLPANPPQVIVDGSDPGINGVNDPFGPNGAAPEAYIDVEWAGAIAPNATINLVIAADTTLESGLILAAERAIYANIAPVMSLSFESCENQLVAYTAGSLWEQAAAQGITVLVASGDEGSADCDRGNPVAVNGQAVNGLASSPWNVAVGGTDFYYSDYNQGAAKLQTQLGTYWNLTASNSTPAASILGVIPEQPWNDTQYGLNIQGPVSGYGVVGGGGGASAVWMPKPAWQTGTGVPADGARDLPDVSLFAGNGFDLSFYPVCAEDGDCQPAASGSPIQISGYGGTSVSAQVFAGMMALVNQQYGPQGQADFVLYPLATQFPKAFNDVTVGSNSMPCDFTDATMNCIAVANPLTYKGITEGQIGSGTTPWYNAGPGYDLASGLGTVDANQMVTNWGKVTFAATKVTMTASTTSFTHGTPITISGAVTAAKGIPTGDVALMTDNPALSNASEDFFTLDNTGAYTGSVNWMPGGTYNIWGQYGGDSVNGLSTSAKTQITVTPETSDTVAYLVNGAGGYPPGPVTVPYGSQVVLHAEPVPDTYFKLCVVPNPPQSCSGAYFGTATGSIAFADGTTPVVTTPLNAEGYAQSNAVFGVGTHSITAAYGGDVSYKASTSAALSLTVTQNTPNIKVVSSAFTSQTTVLGGQTMVFQIEVLNSANIPALQQYGLLLVSPAAAPSGTVTATGLPGGATATATLAPEYDGQYLFPEGVATLTLPATTPAGTYTINVKYSGDTNYASVTTTGTITVVVPTTGMASTISANLSGTISPSSPGVTISGTVTGQTGNPAPTGSVLIVANGIAVAQPMVMAGAGDSSSYTATFNSSMLPPGTNELYVQYTGDSVYNPSATTIAASVSNNLQDFSLQSAGLVPITAGKTGTATVTIYSENGFSGTLTLACSPAPGVTCSIPSSATLTAGGSATATLTINVPTDTANLNYNVAVTAQDSTGAYFHTLGVITQVSGSPAGTQSFAMTNNISAMNLKDGVNSGNTGTVNVYPLGRYSGTVSLSCTIASTTTSGIAPYCSFTNNSVAVSGTNPQSVTLIINTLLGTNAQNTTRSLFWPSTGGAALALVLFFGIPRRRRNWLAMLCLAVALAALGTIGCAKSNFNAGGGQSGGTLGTTPGAYVVTVTGTSGSLSQSTSFNLNITQ